MNPRTLRIALLGLFAASCSRAALADRHYELTDQSSYQQGCYAPCECPLMLAQGMTGGFNLAPDHTDPLHVYYNVTDLDFLVQLFDGSSMRITGAGTYVVGGEVAQLQRMELDLSIDCGETEHFDSGWTTVQKPFPEIQAALSMHGFYCYDTGVFIDARPVRMPGDMNCDAAVDNSDIDAFVLALLDPDGYRTQYPDCDPNNGDTNGDGLLDNSDIDSFVALLLG